MVSALMQEAERKGRAGIEPTIGALSACPATGLPTLSTLDGDTTTACQMSGNGAVGGVKLAV